MCAYTGADDLLRVTRHDLPADSLKRRFKTLVKIPRGQQVPELFKDIYTNDQCPPLNTLAEENFRTIIRVPVTGDTAEEAPEDDEEEEDQAPRKAAPRPTKRPRAKAPGSEAGASGEASAKKPKTTKPPPLDSRKAERARLRMLSTAGQGTRPIIPGAPNPKTAATRTTSQEPITKYMKKSPAVGPSTPVPPSASHPTPQPSPPQADPSPPPAANTPPEIIPVSSGHLEEEDPKAKSPAQEEAETQGQGDAEVTSEKAGEGAGDIVVFPKNFGDPADTTSTPKAYATKFFNKLTEAEKWELEQDLLNAMLNNAWGKPDSRTSEIQDFKKNIGQFCDQLICKQKEQQALHYELHKNIALQRRVTLSQAENIRTLKDENAELAKQLADAQGASSSLATASTELENLRSLYQELETKLKEAELKREQAEKQLAEKNSEHIREKGELELKKNADSETIRRQQKELNGLRKFMETAEQHWDLLNENILEPLGYPEQRRNLFPRDDLLQLAGDDCKDLISASRKICHNLNIKRSRTCDVRKLIGKMDVLPELVIDLQASSARGAAAMALTMCLAHTPGLDLDEVTTGVPPDADVGELLDAATTRASAPDSAPP
nr:formin-like protein 4 [Lolium perenne]